MPKQQPIGADANQPILKVYQLKVSLRGISPLIWRRLLVASSTTIAHLHAIFQVAMGWEDVHLHRFGCAWQRLWHLSGGRDKLCR